MAASATKRKRCENWSEIEKTALFALIEDKVAIIESKQTDTNTNKKKQLAWREIEERFEMIMCTNRSNTQLKEQWKRMKVTAKKNIAGHKKLQKATGGGRNEVVVTEMDWRIHSLLPHEFIKDSNAFDNDQQDDQDNNLMRDSQIQDVDVESQSLYDNETQLNNPIEVLEVENQAQMYDNETQSDDPIVLHIEHEAQMHCDGSDLNARKIQQQMEEHSYNIIADGNFDNDAVLYNMSALTPRSHLNSTLASVGAQAHTTPTQRDLTPRHEDHFMQDSVLTQANTSSNLHGNETLTMTPRTRHIANPVQITVAADVHTANAGAAISQAGSRRTLTPTGTFRMRHDANSTEGERSHGRSRRGQNKASEFEYHQLLMEKKGEEYALKLKQMNEIHELEIKKRQIEIENLLLLQEKIKMELKNMKKKDD